MLMHYQHIWAQKERARIKTALGNTCTACGETDKLEFDCLEPRGNLHHGLGQIQRTCYYRRQMQQGNLQLLCKWCNALKADTPPDKWFTLLASAHSLVTVPVWQQMTPVQRRKCLGCVTLARKLPGDIPPS
jgi:hypothetical protein